MFSRTKLHKEKLFVDLFSLFEQENGVCYMIFCNLNDATF